jgi:hypothetical protein
MRGQRHRRPPDRRRRGAAGQPERGHLPQRHRAAARALHHPVRVPGDPRPRVGRRGRRGGVRRTEPGGRRSRRGRVRHRQRPLRLQHQRRGSGVLRRQGVVAASPPRQPVVDPGRARRALLVRLLRDRAGRQPRRQRHRRGARCRADRPRRDGRGRRQGCTGDRRRAVGTARRARTAARRGRRRRPDRRRLPRPGAGADVGPGRLGGLRGQRSAGPASSTSASTSAAARRPSSDCSSPRSCRRAASSGLPGCGRRR